MVIYTYIYIHTYSIIQYSYFCPLNMFAVLHYAVGMKMMV